MLTSAQIRAGRALIGWEQTKLAAEAGVGPETIKRLERSTSALSAAREETKRAIISALAKGGVALVENDGVALSRPTAARAVERLGEAWIEVSAFRKLTDATRQARALTAERLVESALAELRRC